MRHPTIIVAVVSVAAVACSSTPASKPGVPVEVPIATASAAPPAPLEADAGVAGEADGAEGAQKALAKKEKTRQCNALIEVINEGIRSLENSAGTSTGADDFRQMADVLDGVKAKVTNVRLTLGPLKEYAAAYRKMTSEVAKSAREMAAAADAMDMAKLTSAKAALNKAVAMEDPLVDEINRFCQAP
jgi:hypothetical protein